MNPNIEAKNKQEEIDHAIILKSFCVVQFNLNLIEDLKSLVLDDVHLSEAEIAKHRWRSIYSESNWGAIDVELDELTNWWGRSGIAPVYATSRERIVNHDEGKVLVTKIDAPYARLMNRLQLGSWMFGDIPDLAVRRISDWRADVWFSDPLRFVVLSEHDGYGTTSVAGPAELIDAFKTYVSEDYDWKDGVIPASNRGAAFPPVVTSPKKPRK